MLRELDDMPDYDITELNAQLNNIRSGMELCSNTINEYNSRLNSKENELDELSSYESQLNGLEADYETLLANYNNLLKAKDYLEKARISYAALPSFFLHINIDTAAANEADECPDGNE